MKRGDHVIVDIESLTTGGDGLAVHDGRDVVVQRAVPGDRAEVYLRRRRKGRFEAVVHDLIESAVPRHDPPCIHFGLCGGCRWQDVGYKDQLRLKESIVREALLRNGVEVNAWREIQPSPELFYYRNKMEFSFSADRDGLPQLGLHVRERYNRVFDLEACLLQSEVSNLIVDSFRTHATRLRLPVYDLRVHEGLLRFLVVRDAKGTGQIMVNLVVSTYPSDDVDDLLAAVLDDLGKRITTCVVTRHSGKAQVAAGEHEFLIRGPGRITEICGGLEFEISPQSFFQTNTRAAERLYATVVEFAGDLEAAEVLDLYAGTGGVSLHLARRARSVLAVEQVPEAVADARRNAERNGIDNCTFVAEPAETALKSPSANHRARYAVAVADPPRAGIHARVLSGLIELGVPVLIYVSCNAETMGSDVAVLSAGGYELEIVQPLDMFPHTPHCEVVARLRRSSRWERKAGAEVD